MKNAPFFLPLKPAISRKVWGGERLASRATENGSEPVGETWEVSIHPDGPAFYQGRPLTELYTESDIPYLVKLIDTSDYLSVQVHPDDAFAAEFEHSQGKTECWVVLDAHEGDGIYLGLKKGVTKESFERALLAGGNMADLLQFRPVTRGDFYFVPAGTIHAIGKNVMLAEVQQSSGITYRVWDWNRVDAEGKSRELHVGKALQVIRFEEEFNRDETFEIHHALFECEGDVQLVRHPQFNLDLYNLSSGVSEDIKLKDNGRTHSLLCLEGKATLSNGQEKLEINQYDACILNTKSFKIEVREPIHFLLIT